MRKILKTIPLTISVASIILFIYNKIMIHVRNAAMTDEIRKTLNIYLTISVFSFILYLIVCLIFYIFGKKERYIEVEENYRSGFTIDSYIIINAIKLIFVIAGIIFLGYKIYMYRINIPYLY